MNMLSLTAPVATLSAGEMVFADRVAYAGELTLIGMVMIFAVLAVVWGAISIMRVLLHGKEETNVASKSVEAKRESPAVAPAPTPAPAPVANDDAALLAAITAAIAVVWESEYPGTGFRVVSYRHVEKRSAWNIK